MLIRLYPPRDRTMTICHLFTNVTYDTIVTVIIIKQAKTHASELRYEKKLTYPNKKHDNMSEKRGIVIFVRNSPITGHMQMGGNISQPSTWQYVTSGHIRLRLLIIMLYLVLLYHYGKVYHKIIMIPLYCATNYSFGGSGNLQAPHLQGVRGVNYYGVV